MVCPLNSWYCPKQCRNTVLHLAHDIPLAGHLGKGKTSQRVLERFYWPTLYRDVANFCKRCGCCQKASRYKGKRAPLVPLLIIDVLFKRIMMDIIGPLPRSRSGNKYSRTSIIRTPVCHFNVKSVQINEFVQISELSDKIHYLAS